MMKNCKSEDKEFISSISKENFVGDKGSRDLVTHKDKGKDPVTETDLQGSVGPKVRYHHRNVQ